MQPFGRGIFLRMFGSAVLIQALLSAMSLVVGLVLIRHTADIQYGFYVLAANAGLLLSGLQSAFVQPAMVPQLFSATRAERAELVGGLFRQQRLFLLTVSGALVVAIFACWLGGILRSDIALLGVATVASVTATLHREAPRMMLFAHRRSHDVLKSDACYVALGVSSVPLATLSPYPAATALFALALSATVSGALGRRYLWRFEPWSRNGPSVLRVLAPLGGWAATGSAMHWAFSQGYNYLVAAVLDVSSVAALAATRLLLMPINLLSSGIMSLMMPTAIGWQNAHGPTRLFKRLCTVACALVLLAAIYFAVLWLARSFVFAELLHKQFAQLDSLLLAWCAVFMTMVFRDQLQFLPAANGKFRASTFVTGTAAVVSLTIGYFFVSRMGVLGAPFGVLAGELVNLAGIVLLSVRLMRSEGHRGAPEAMSVEQPEA